MIDTRTILGGVFNAAADAVHSMIGALHELPSNCTNASVTLDLPYATDDVTYDFTVRVEREVAGNPSRYRVITSAVSHTSLMRNKAVVEAAVYEANAGDRTFSGVQVEDHSVIYLINMEQ